MNKNALIPTLALAGATSLAVMLTPVAAMALTFNVNRSWSQSGNNASLVGTVDVALGSYTIQNGSPNPFTNVNLTLTVNGNPFALNAADTNSILGTGQFLVNATSSTLTFNTANANGSNPADLAFVNSATGFSGQFYGIGTDTAPGFEVAFNTSPNVTGSVAFGVTPVTFGTAQETPSVPESSATLGLLGLGLLGIGSGMRKMRKD